MEDNQFPREISLCLSGGAVRGAYHLGVISVLEEHKVKINAISATSIGALIGASLACGKKSNEILNVLKSPAFKKVFQLRLGKGYLFKIDMQAKVLDLLINKMSFEDLAIPLEISVTDVDNADILYINSGVKLREYILASCSITPLIKPVSIDNKLFIDGGLIDNFPVQRLKKYPYPIVGINLYPYSKKRVSSIFGWIKKMFFIVWQSENLAKRDLCDLYVSSEALKNISSFNYRDLDKAYELGREEMKSILESKN
ncbi:MAG: patatin-like phospholipase family protein [Campylobacterota bacterium]|nr:patatin-like phospholipase family protein [Campylobacterota bacterium]